MAVSAAELTEDLQVRGGLTLREASGIAFTINRAVEGATTGLVTRDQLDTGTAELKRDIAELRAELKGDIANLRADMAELRMELKGDIAALRVEMHSLVRQQTIWLGGLLLTVLTLTLAGLATVATVVLRALP